MSDSVAFAPKVEYSDPDCLGTIFVSDSATLNVREAVQEGKGYVVADDPETIAALDRYEAMKRVSLSEVEAKQTKKPSGAAVSGDGGKS